MTLEITELLALAKQKGASDLHLTVGIPPKLRIHGELVDAEGWPPLSREDVHGMLYDILTDAQKARFEEHLDLDFSVELSSLGRFRVNVFFHRQGEGAVFRLIPSRIKTIQELGLPPVLEDLALRDRGLILVTGPTGSGKSTTLAAMIDKINKERPVHIITIEDPIEYLHSHQKAMVNQRELHSDTLSYANALRSVLREDPDVVLIGEMRDLETIEAALQIAETGHLTFATLHTNSAPQTINRIIDVFPEHQQPQVRAQLSFVLEGIICQSLLPKASGKGRVLACEVLIPNAAVRNLIREDKIHQIYSVMQTGQLTHGMQTFNQSLATLYQRRLIKLETALSYSSNPDELQDLINRGVGVVQPPVAPRVGGRS